MNTDDQKMDTVAAGGEMIDAAIISTAVAGVLAAVDGDVGVRRPVCRASGKCCKFEAYGHRLYVTGVEMVHFKRVMQGRATPVQAGGDATPNVPLTQFFARGTEDQKGCPYQVEGLCTAREARPLGCRIYFCDENAQGWQNEVYEKYHAQLRQLHEQANVPYRYMEWRAALKEMLQSE